MKTIAVFPNTEKIESAGVLERITDFFADKDVRLVMLSFMPRIFPAVVLISAMWVFWRILRCQSWKAGCKSCWITSTI